MKLPNADHAVIDMRKLTDYCLNPEHSIGKHKARVFQSALGLGSADAPQLRRAILDAIVYQEAQLGELDDYGQRFTVDFIMTTRVGTASVRSAWIIRTDENFPRLTSCLVL